MSYIPAARIIGFLLLLATVSCASLENTPRGDPAPATALTGAAASAESPAGGAPPITAKPDRGVAAEPPKPPATLPAAQPANEKPANAGPPAAKPVDKVAAAPAPKEPAAKKPAPASAPEKPAAPPPLGLDTLEKRLKDTNAIGVFTKLTLKNQVDDLVERFKAYYAGRAKTTLAELRQPYDSLILKVLTLLQDGDPSLANAIRSSREAIWGILSDPAKFSKLAS